MRSAWPLAALAGCAVAALASAAAARDGFHVFVSSEKDNAVSVLDGRTYALVKTIPTAARPRHLQFSPDRTRIFAACGDGNAIDIIDVARLALVDRIAGIDDPELFDLSADGKTLYIALEDDARLGILDLETYFAERRRAPDLSAAARRGSDDEDASLPGLTTVEVGAEPEGVLAAPDGRTVYVTSEVANIVHVVDAAAGRIRANIVVGNRPRRLALTGDGKQLWVSNELGGSLSVIDTATNRVVDTIAFLPRGFRPEEVTPVGITMTRDGRTAIVALGRANHVAFVDVASRKIEDYVLVGKRAWNATLNRTNTLLFVANGLSDDISIIDVATRKSIRSVPVGRVPHTVLIDD